MIAKENAYRPILATVKEIRLEAGGERPIRTFRIQIDDPQAWKAFVHKPGQFVVVSSFGTGESVFAITSQPSTEGIVEVSVMRVGNVTHRLHELEVGDRVGVRGPFGNSFPVEEWKHKDLVFIAAGIGISPLRSVYPYVLSPERRKEYGKVTLIYGARTPDDLAYKEEFKELEDRDDLELWLCIDWKIGSKGPILESAHEDWPAINKTDRGCLRREEKGFRFTCFVPELVEVVAPKPGNAVAVTCGPPLAIKFVIRVLERLGWAPNQIYTTLENQMKCGIGKCGRCNIGGDYVCKDGPVYTYEKIKSLPPDF